MTALPDLLRRTMATTAFRLAAASAAGFLLVAAIIVGVLFWQTNEILTEQVISGLRAEAAELARQAVRDGIAALADTMPRAQPPGGAASSISSPMPTAQKIAGNLNRLPPEIGGSPQGGVFRYENVPAAGRVSRLGVAIPVDVGPGAHARHRPRHRGAAQLCGAHQAHLPVGLRPPVARGHPGGALLSGGRCSKRIEAINARRAARSWPAISRGAFRFDGSRDELDDLAASLNAMLDRIEQLMGGLREVSDNIAHDLKTPLNRLRNRAEAALRDARGAEAYREGLERTIEEADELIKTFNALLAHRAPRSGRGRGDGARASISAISCATWPSSTSRWPRKRGSASTSRSSDGIEISANRQLVGQAVANLVDNAIKYACRGAAETGSAAHRGQRRRANGQHGRDPRRRPRAGDRGEGPRRGR